jgi:hypothetical protein
MAGQAKSGSAGGPFRFRVSDVVDVPLRGYLLRLRLAEGTPKVGDLAVGRMLHLSSPAGTSRDVAIVDHAVTGGRQTQARLERTREMDLLISREDAGRDGSLVAIGWMARGPVSERGTG